MSSILRALRKLEHEKSELGEGSVDLARDILKRSYAEHRSTPVWLMLAGTVAAAAGMIAAGWWLFAPAGVPQQARVHAENPVATAAPVVPVLREEQPVAPQPLILMPNRLVEQPTEAIPPQKKTVTAKKSAPEKVAAAALLIPDLTIEEIVYVADPSARLAVINELPVMQGTDIEGARVVEILPDRVRFEFKGVRFDKFKSTNR